VTISLVNLKQFGTAHATYSSEWDGRQWTTSPDDLTVLISGSYSNDYSGFSPLVPRVPLGFTRDGDHVATGRHWAIVPMWYPSNCSLGSFRSFHTKPFNNYINSKVYDKMFWAPKDYTINESIFQWMQDPGEWPANTSTFYFSTYCTSVAAQVSPDVYRGISKGRSQRAISLPGGHRSPSLSSASYPDLKTHMLEHYWLQNNPSESITGTQVPWFFNMGPDSTPATLFYDGHTRMMSVREAVRSDQRVLGQGGDSLVAFDPACFGSGGYFENYAYNGAFDEINSYHVFTRDGIKGRDTTGS
jgi:hypothetical protein